MGLAVLVTVLSAAAGHDQLQAGAGVPTGMVHGLDLTFGVAAVFGIAALVMVGFLVRLPAPGQEVGTAMAASSHGTFDEFELVDGEGFEWPEPGPELVA